MLKIFKLTLFFTLFLFGDEHFAKLEPIETITVKSEVSGKVVVAKGDLEGKIANGLIVKIDDRLDKIEINSTLNSIKVIDKMIKVNQNILPSLKKNFENKKILYQKVTPLKSSSISQKDSLYSAYISARTQYSGTLEKILNLKNQKISLLQKVATLKDRVKKKDIIAKNSYLYSLNVKKGEFVNIGMTLAILQNITKAKLIIFLSEDELKDIDKKRIYLDGKKTNLKFSKVWRVADKKYISSYKAEIILKPFTRFSKLIKVEIK